MAKKIKRSIEIEIKANERKLEKLNSEADKLARIIEKLDEQTNQFSNSTEEQNTLADEYIDQLSRLNKEIEKLENRKKQLTKVDKQNIEIEKIIRREHKKTSKSLGDLESKLQDLTTQYAKQGRITGKTFRNLSHTIGQRVDAMIATYAKLTVAMVGLASTFQVLKDAADFKVLQQSIDILTANFGINARKLTKDLRNITNGALSTKEAMRQVAFGIASGLDEKMFKELSQVARNAAVAMGRDVPDSIDRMIRGVLKMETEILDELGILVRVEEAVNKYAVSVNKSTKELTSHERVLAFANLALERGQQQYSALGEVGVSEILRLHKTMEDLLQDVLNPIVSVLEVIAKLINESGALAASVFGAGIATLVGFAVPTEGRTEAIRLRRIAELEDTLKLTKSIKNVDEELVNHAKEELEVLKKNKATSEKLFSMFRSTLGFLKKAGILSLAITGALELGRVLSDTFGTKGVFDQGLKNLTDKFSRFAPWLMQLFQVAFINIGNFFKEAFKDPKGTIKKLFGIEDPKNDRLTILHKQLASKQDKLSQLQKQTTNAPIQALKKIIREGDPKSANVIAAQISLKYLNQLESQKITRVKSIIKNIKTKIKELEALETQKAQGLPTSPIFEDASLGGQTQLEQRLKEQKAIHSKVLDIQRKIDTEKGKKHGSIEDQITSLKTIKILRNKLLQLQDQALSLNNANYLLSLRQKDSLKEQVKNTTDLINNTIRGSKEDNKRLDLLEQYAELQSKVFKEKPESDIIQFLRLRGQLNMADTGAGISAITTAEKIISEGKITDLAQAINSLKGVIAVQEELKNANLGVSSTLEEIINNLEKLINKYKEQKLKQDEVKLSATGLFSSLGIMYEEFIGKIEDSTKKTLQGLDQVFSNFGSFIQAAGQAAVSAIDAQISALESLDNKSEGQNQKLFNLKKQRIEEEKKFAKQSIVIQTAVAAMQAFAGALQIGGPLALPLAIASAAFVTAAGAQQLSAVDNSAAGQLAALSNQGTGTVREGANIEFGTRVDEQDISKRAGGGPISGASLVGELGPELFIPNVSGEVKSDTTVNNSPSVNIQIQTVDANSFQGWLANNRSSFINEINEHLMQEQGRSL